MAQKKKSSPKKPPVTKSCSKNKACDLKNKKCAKTCIKNKAQDKQDTIEPSMNNQLGVWDKFLSLFNRRS